MNRTQTTLAITILLLLFGSTAKADVISDWNAIMLTTISGQNPFAQGRFAAITHLAIFEAVNAITPKYQPYLGTIVAPATASPEAAAVAAAYRVLVTYFPGAVANLDAARAASLATIPDGPAKDAGLAAGEMAAGAMISLRANDGSSPPEFYVPPSTNPGQWQVTPSCPPAGGVLLHWSKVTPFGIVSADQFRSDAPPALKSIKYTRDFNEVKEVGDIDSTERPPDRADVARFYNAVPAPPVWNSVVRQVAATQNHALVDNARTFALVNVAISDAAVAVFDTKYHYNLWRPETAIRAGYTDDNPRTDGDPSFLPYILTPCFPSYPSAHASLSYAAREVIERIYGARRHALVLSSPAIPDVTLEYTKYKQITDDIDDARVYGGIHFRFDQEAGAEQGRHIGEYVYSHKLGSLPPHMR